MTGSSRKVVAMRQDCAARQVVPGAQRVQGHAQSHPSWYLVASNDEAIPPDAERMFAQRMGARTVEASSGHLAMVSHPAEVVALIEDAAEAVRRSSGESAAVAQHA